MKKEIKTFDGSQVTDIQVGLNKTGNLIVKVIAKDYEIDHVLWEQEDATLKVKVWSDNRYHEKIIIRLDSDVMLDAHEEQSYLDHTSTKTLVFFEMCFDDRIVTPL